LSLTSKPKQHNLALYLTIKKNLQPLYLFTVFTSNKFRLLLS